MLGAVTASAQLYITEKEFFMHDVTDEGIAIGTPGNNAAFQMWNPLMGNFTYVGGMSSGNGIGGVSRISGDGKLVFGAQAFDNILVPTEWSRLVYPEFGKYVVNGFLRISAQQLFATAVCPEGGSIVLESAAGDGMQWISNVSGTTLDDVRITCSAYAGPYLLMVGCEGGAFFTSKGNSVWTAGDPRPTGDETVVKAITAMDFTKMTGQIMNYDGGVGYEAEDGSYGVWYTSDATSRYADFHAAEGVAGVPTCIRLSGENFYMTTANGHIQKSADKCKTWTDIFTTEDPLYKIVFADDKKGIALSDEKVYITLDGGENWSAKTVIASVSPWSAENAGKWNDVVWEGDRIILAGNAGLLYVSEDNGSTFTRITGLPSESADSDLAAVTYSENVMNLGAGGGTFLRKNDDSYVEGVCAARYDVASDTWSQMETLGTFNIGVKPVASSVENISDDGRYAVGLAYGFESESNTTQGYGAIWDEEGKITRLGNMFALEGKNAKATAVSADGSVVVGWQDKKGPWMASVWRRQEDGTYKQSLLFKDADTKIEDIDFDDFKDIAENCPGSANAVSPNGKWIGGNGGGEWTAIKEAWIWSEETGFITLDGEGTTMEVSDDGNTAIGYGASGLSAWIWTKETGRRDLNDVAADLGADFDGFSIISVYAMSPNGRYVAGWGMRGDSKLGYVLDLKKLSDVEQVNTDGQAGVSVYYNRGAGEINVDLKGAESSGDISIALFNMQGAVCRQLDNCAMSNRIDVGDLLSGIYLLDVRMGKSHNAFKIIVK